MTKTDQSPQDRLTGKRGGKRADQAFHAYAFATAALVLAVLVLIAITTINESTEAFGEAGLDFVLSDRWAPNAPEGPQFGVLAFMAGTLVSSLIGLLIAVPISVGIALFLTELAHRRVRAVAITFIDLLAAVPSVVFGLVGFLVVAPKLADFYGWLHDTFGGIWAIGSVFGEPSATGNAILTAGFVLAVMIIPIITSISREVFDTVPLADKQAAYALGATRWEMIRGAVFPHSFGGLVGGTMLGLGRAMGETIAVSMVIGSATYAGANILGPGNSMAAVIAQQWGEAGELTKSALVGIGVVLFAITIAINFTARVIVRRAEVRMRGAAA